MKKFIYKTVAILAFFLSFFGKTNAQTWEKVGNNDMPGNSWNTWNLTEYKGKIYATSGGNLKRMDLYCLDNNTWKLVTSVTGSEWNSWIGSLQVYNNYLYIAGDFDSVGGVYMPCLAKFDGSSWSGFLNKFDSLEYVQTMCLYKNKLILGVDREDIVSPRILSLDSNFIQDLVLDRKGITSIQRLHEYNGELYIASVPNLYVYNGDSVRCLPYEIGGQIWAMAHTSKDLYAAGHIYEIDSSSANSIFISKGNSWISIDSGVRPWMSSVIFTMISHKESIFVGGWFDTAGNVPANHVAYYDTTWHEISGGANGTISSLLIFDGFLYIAGDFDTAGGKPIKYVARIKLPEAANSTQKFNDTNQKRIVVYPNPCTNQIFIDGVIPNSKFEICDALGRTTVSGVMKGNLISIDQKPGIYFLRIEQKDDIFQTKIIVE